MSVTQTEEKRGRGRPKKETAGPVKKIKLKHSPKTAYEDYYKKYVTRDKVLLVYAGNPDGMDGFGAFIVKKIST